MVLLVLVLLVVGFQVSCVSSGFHGSSSFLVLVGQHAEWNMFTLAPLNLMRRLFWLRYKNSIIKKVFSNFFS